MIFALILLLQHLLYRSNNIASLEDNDLKSDDLKSENEACQIELENEISKFVVLNSQYACEEYSYVINFPCNNS